MGIGLFDGRDRLKAALGAYAAYRAGGPAGQRFAARTWNRHMSVLSSFYQWAVAEGHAARGAVQLRPGAGPFTATRSARRA